MAHKFKRRSKSARASLIFGKDFQNVWKHASILDWKKNGVNTLCFLSQFSGYVLN